MGLDAMGSDWDEVSDVRGAGSTDIPGLVFVSAGKAGDGQLSATVGVEGDDDAGVNRSEGGCSGWL
jgi:hypothetical protein